MLQKMSSCRALTHSLWLSCCRGSAGAIMGACGPSHSFWGDGVLTDCYNCELLFFNVFDQEPEGCLKLFCVSGYG